MQHTVPCRLVLAKREAKVVTEADTEMLDYWYDMENDFELLSFKAWNKTIIQVCLFGPPQPCRCTNACLESHAVSCATGVVASLLSVVHASMWCKLTTFPCTMQFVRTFVLTRVTLKSFHNLSGLDQCVVPPDSAMIGSNVYSASEGLLLGWLTMHLQKVCMQYAIIYAIYVYHMSYMQYAIGVVRACLYY